MKTVYKVILINFASLIGCVTSVVLIAPQMSLRMSGVLCLVTLAVMNAVFLRWYARGGDNRGFETSRPKSTGTGSLILAILAFLLTTVIAWMEWHVWRK
jgi:hypothetical protein